MEKVNKPAKHTTELGYLTITSAYEGKDGKRYVEGYASTADIDSRSDRITLEALRNAQDSLVQNYGILLFNHDSNRPTGRIVKAEVDNKGLKIVAFISKQADQIWDWIQEGVINSFSIGGFIVKAVKFFDKTANQMVREIRALDLVEVSLVSLPANSNAKTTGFYVGKALDVADIEDLTEKTTDVEIEQDEIEIKQEVEMADKVTDDEQTTEEEIEVASSDEKTGKELDESEVTKVEKPTDEEAEADKTKDKDTEEEEVITDPETDKGDEDEVDPDLVEELVDTIVEKVEAKLLPVLEAKITSIIEEKIPKKQAKESKSVKESDHPEEDETLDSIMKNGDDATKAAAMDACLASYLKRG